MNIPVLFLKNLKFDCRNNIPHYNLHSFHNLESEDKGQVRTTVEILLVDIWCVSLHEVEHSSALKCLMVVPFCSSFT